MQTDHSFSLCRGKLDLVRFHLLRKGTLKAYGRVDVLVNNAGVQVEKTVTESSDVDWDDVMGINARGIFLCCREFVPVMTEQGSGAIINIGSISGNHADPTMALYNASKAFVHGLTRSIAVDHRSSGIRCNAISPGWIMTGMADAAWGSSSNGARRVGFNPAQKS